MRVLQIGSKVLVGGDIPARIIGVAIYVHRMQYQVAWWDGRTRLEAWVDELEIDPFSTDQRTEVTFAPVEFVVREYKGFQRPACPGAS